MYKFHKTYLESFDMAGRPGVTITDVIAEGASFGEMLSACQVFAEDQAGNLVLTSLSELESLDSAAIRADIAEFVRQDELLLATGSQAVLPWLK